MKNGTHVQKNCSHIKDGKNEFTLQKILKKTFLHVTSCIPSQTLFLINF